MEQKKDIIENCLYYFHNGYSCSEAILQAGMDEFGLTSDCTPAVASVFGGGIKSLGHICGAISGTLMLIGIMHGKHSLEDSCEEADRLALEFLDYCEKEFGTLMCRDITGINFREEEYPSEKCTNIIESNCVPLLKKICLWQKENLG
ncbi:C_GCAxxG_C_C family protein [Clostridia bacterium]|nr:C_GCAxxG_C_C family protein [Clostridia bacterium]